jgi:DNA-binding transcriptional LysR family regulator
LLRVPVARPPELAFIELLQEELLVVLPAGHRLLARRGKAGLDLRELAEERFILVRRPGAQGIYENLILACRAAGFEARVVAEVAHMLTNINLVAAGAGVSVVPASMREVNLRQVGYRRLQATPGLTAPLTLGHVADDASPVLHNFITTTRRLLDAATPSGPRGEAHEGAPRLDAAVRQRLMLAQRPK